MPVRIIFRDIGKLMVFYFHRALSTEKIWFNLALLSTPVQGS